MNIVFNVNEGKRVTVKPMQGVAKDGTVYGVNNVYLTENGNPILPIMGEFHFSRYPREEWRQALLKMKAGGINIVASYVFWNHHEEEKGVYDFEGNKDVRAFLELCNEVGLKVWFRIGPWAHGESRNGGFPDWLCEELNHNGLGPLDDTKPYRYSRTNDELYMKYVTAFWTALAKQAEGMYVKDDGPILGVQLENEYCHAGGAPTREIGVDHMIALKKLALELGYIAPYYTSTGWGGGMVLEDETLPVMGGYIDAPWADSIEELPASENFLFTPFHDDSNIATDLATGILGGYNIETNPYLTAELGGGMQPTHHRRVYPYPEDIEAQALCMLGAGANLIGYYMYHGGVNPMGKFTTLEETPETGYFNTLPKMTYDFQTCLRETGKINTSYHYTRRLHTFINSFTEELAPAQFIAATVQPSSPEDMTTPRVSLRYNADMKCGFIFINNHQRKRSMAPISDLTVTINFPDGTTKSIEHINCKTSTTAIIPFGLDMGNGCRLEATNASILARIGQRVFLYTDDLTKAYCDFGQNTCDNITIISKEDADHAYIFGNKLYITDKQLFEDDGKIYILSSEDCTVKVYSEDGSESAINVSIATGTLNDKYLHIDFDGDKAEAYDADGKLLTDWFSTGEEWVIATKRYGYAEDFDIKVYPFEDNIYYDLPPKKGCQINNKYLESEYLVCIA